MAVTVHLQLLAGHPAVTWVADPDVEISLGRALRGLSFRRRSPTYDLGEIVGAPTLRLVLSGSDLPLPLIVERRFGRVRIGDWVADDSDERLLTWDGLRAPGALPADALTVAIDMLRASPPEERRAIAGIPGGPTPDEQAQPCPAAPSSTDTADWIIHAGSNNCYNYAANHLFEGGTCAVPGAGGGPPLQTGADCQAITQALARDRIERSDPVPPSCPAGGHYIMVMKREWRYSSDFHCLRLNADGRWTHKDGMGAPSDLDDCRHEMRSMRSASFAYAWTFCGFFFVGPDRVIRPQSRAVPMKEVLVARSPGIHRPT